MRPATPWRLEPTLRFLAMLPLALAVAMLAIAVAARGLAGGTGGTGTGPQPAWLMAAGTGIIHAITLLLLLPLLRTHGLGWRDAFGFGTGPWLRNAALALGLTLPAMAATWALHQGSAWLLDRVGIPHDAQATVDAVRNASRPWEISVLFVFAAITAPVAEELVFRGILWPLAREQGWRIRGAAGVSLVFAAIHFNAAALIPLTALGIFWIWLYERTGDLTAPILSHAAFNAVNFAWIALAPP